MELSEESAELGHDFRADPRQRRLSPSFSSLTSSDTVRACEAVAVCCSRWPETPHPSGQSYRQGSRDVAYMFSALSRGVCRPRKLHEAMCGQVLVNSQRDELLISPPFAVDRAAAGLLTDSESTVALSVPPGFVAARTARYCQDFLK